MLPAFLLGLREGIEAALIVSIVLAFLAKTGARSRFPSVWAGVGLAVLFSVVVGAALFVTGGELEGTSEQLFEGSAMLLAVAVLTWMILWMRRQAAGMRRTLEVQVGEAVAGGSSLALVALAFLAVGREGLETALFLLAAAGASGVSEALIGGVAGLAAAVAVGYGIYRGSRWFDLRSFFRVSGVLLIIFAAGLLSHGAHEFTEAGMLPATPVVWDLSATLPDGEGVGQWLRTLVGYSAAPTVLELVTWGAYLVVALAVFFRPFRPVSAPRDRMVAVGQSRRSTTIE
jgi:high-affinity iron transporter